MTTAPATTCYRHPDRPTGRHCTRCGRPACPDCLREASVGAQCVECVKDSQPTTAQRFQLRWRADHMLATKIIVGINVVAFALIGLKDQNFNGSGPTSAKLALFGPAVHNGDYYRLVTSSVVHYGFIHILFNMLVLWQVGMLLERGAGHIRFATLYLVSVLAGSAGALIATPHTLVGGASGGVFGVAAAATLVMYRQGVRFWETGFGPLLVINLVLNFTIMSGVSIGGHIGGLIGGALAAEAMIQARKANQPMLGYVGAAFVGAASVLIALSVAGT
jgi:membrane associated rhomboid family serine protease